jgi:hypothetical protein
VAVVGGIGDHLIRAAAAKSAPFPAGLFPGGDEAKRLFDASGNLLNNHASAGVDQQLAFIGIKRLGRRRRGREWSFAKLTSLRD